MFNKMLLAGMVVIWGSFFPAFASATLPNQPAVQKTAPATVMKKTTQAFATVGPQPTQLIRPAEGAL